MSTTQTTQALPEDEYLSTQELLELKAVLEDQLVRILGRTQDAVSELTQEESSDADTLDIAVKASNREFMLRLADRERRMLGKIKGGLARMAEGEYGTCEGCGGAITYGRLLARPVATMCIDCKTEAEQMGPRKSAF
ncbi:MAG: TraR/DksA family transcriptional regulator [Myxococcota bacterium]